MKPAHKDFIRKTARLPRKGFDPIVSEMSLKELKELANLLTEKEDTDLEKIELIQARINQIMADRAKNKTHQG